MGLIAKLTVQKWVSQIVGVISLCLALSSISCTIVESKLKTSSQLEKPELVYKLDNGINTVDEIEILVLYDKERDKHLELKIYYPKEFGAYPIIIFSHGNGGSKDSSSEIGRFLASHGYCVICPTHSDSVELWRRHGGQGDSGKWTALSFTDQKRWTNRPRDISFVIDSLGNIEEKMPVLKGKMNHKQIGVGGYSFGAHTAQLLAGARIELSEDAELQNYADERVTAVVLLSGQGRGQVGMRRNSWDELTRPMLYVTGTQDMFPVGQLKVDWRIEPYIFSPPGDKYLLFVDGMGHNLKRCGWHYIEVPEAFEYIKIAMIAFWDTYLKNDEEAKGYLRSNKLEKFSEHTLVFSQK